MSKEILVTEEGKQKLEEELNFYKTVKRKEVVEAIRVALSFGDLSENSEYDEAKTEQAKVESRIAELEDMLLHVKVITEGDVKTNVINVGNVVTVYNETYDETTDYSIVGQNEADPFNNLISDQSPIGSALMGATIGDRVCVNTPNGPMYLIINNIKKRN